MRKIDYAIGRIHRAIKKIENDRFTPAVISPEIPDYLVDLAATHSADSSSLDEFLISLPANAILNEMLIQVSPDKKRDAIINLRADHEDLETQKYTEIEKQNFDKAAECRDRQLEISGQIRELLQHENLVVTSQTIEATLNSLGWSEKT